MINVDILSGVSLLDSTSWQQDHVSTKISLGLRFSGMKMSIDACSELYCEPTLMVIHDPYVENDPFFERIKYNLKISDILEFKTNLIPPHIPNEEIIFTLVMVLKKDFSIIELARFKSSLFFTEDLSRKLKDFSDKIFNLPDYS